MTLQWICESLSYKTPMKILFLRQQFFPGLHGLRAVTSPVTCICWYRLQTDHESLFFNPRLFINSVVEFQDCILIFPGNRNVSWSSDPGPGDPSSEGRGGVCTSSWMLNVTATKWRTYQQTGATGTRPPCLQGEGEWTRMELTHWCLGDWNFNEILVT